MWIPGGLGMCTFHRLLRGKTSVKWVQEKRKDHLCHFFRFHKELIPCDICLLPLSGLLHLVWYFLGPSMLLQMALFNSFYGWVILHCICVSHFMYPYVDRHLGCSHVLAIVNSIAMNVMVHVSFQIRIFSQYMSRSGTVRSYGDSSNIHWKEYSLKRLR